jgi:hypothetical protein
MKATINAPVTGYTGTVVGVHFSDGTGEAETAAAIGYFQRHGYEVTVTDQGEITIPTGTPTRNWSLAQLSAYAEREEIDLGEAKTKKEILAVIAAEAVTPDDGTSEASDVGTGETVED